MAYSPRNLSANAGLLDARGTAQVITSLSSRFTAVEFADFCTIAEEIALRDQIILVGKLDRLPKSLRAALRPLIDAGIFVSYGEAFSIPELPIDARQLRATEHAIEYGLTTASVDDATFEARRLLGGEAHFGVPSTPLLRQLQHFGLVRRPLVETTVWDLAAQYRTLSDRAQAIRSGLQTLSGLPQMSVPPIALRAIQRSRSYEQIIPAILELRDELKPLRDHFRDLKDRLRGGAMSPAEVLELQSAWEQKWERLADKLGASGKMALARTSIPLLKNGLRIAKCVVVQDALDAAATAVGWIGPGIEMLGGLQLRPVHRSVANYLSMSDREVLRAVARIFDADLVRIDADMSALAYQPESPWRLAMDDRRIENYTTERSMQRSRRRFLLDEGRGIDLQRVSNHDASFRHQDPTLNRARPHRDAGE